jgi:hypothetical protein
MPGSFLLLSSHSPSSSRIAVVPALGLGPVLISMQKHSAGLIAMTERTLGAKAGHLELLKGGKKNKDGKDGKDAKGKPIEAKKGGSKKFG